MYRCCVVVLTLLWCHSASAQQRPLIIDHIGGQPLGRQLALALRDATSNLKQGAGHRVLLVTGPSPCQSGIVVSLTVTKAETFLSSAVMVVMPNDVNSVAQNIAAGLAENLR